MYINGACSSFFVLYYKVRRSSASVRSVGHDSSEEEQELPLQTRNNETILLLKQ